MVRQNGKDRIASLSSSQEEVSGVRLGKIVIGITDCVRYENYEQWVLNEPGVEVIRLSHREDNFSDIQKCEGILMTGGEDIHPKFYNRPEYLPFCMSENIDSQRDEFELKVLEYSQTNQLPLLGICRGLQITNIYFNGTLIPDIPASGKPDHSKINEGNDRYHTIYVHPNTMLEQIAGIREGEVNSAHHQSVDKIGNNLQVNAVSKDGIIEGMERKETDGAFLLLVQWHPERLNDQQSPFSKKIKESFLNAVKVRTWIWGN